MARLTSMDKEVLYAQPGGGNCKVAQKRLWVYNSNGGCKKKKMKTSDLICIHRSKQGELGLRLRVIRF